jgi:hypothetical protein
MPCTCGTGNTSVTCTPANPSAGTRCCYCEENVPPYTCFAGTKNACSTMGPACWGITSASSGQETGETVYLSNITGMVVDYYGYSPGTMKCTTCASLANQKGAYCGDNATAGCCGTDPVYGKLTCDNYTRTCEPETVTINPCSSAPDSLWGNTVYCPSACEYGAEPGITCSEYLGNGALCQAKANNKENFVDCRNYTDPVSCNGAPGSECQALILMPPPALPTDAPGRMRNPKCAPALERAQPIPMLQPARRTLHAPGSPPVR